MSCYDASRSSQSEARTTGTFSPLAPSKYYAIDNALRRVNSPNLTPDTGHRLENAVFLSLRRSGIHSAYAGENVIDETHIARARSPVGSKNPCGRSVIEFQEAAEALAGLDLTGGAADPVCFNREKDQVVFPLVVPLLVIMPSVVREHMAERRLAEQEQLREALLFY